MLRTSSWTLYFLAEDMRRFPIVVLHICTSYAMCCVRAEVLHVSRASFPSHTNKYGVHTQTAEGTSTTTTAGGSGRVSDPPASPPAARPNVGGPVAGGQAPIATLVEKVIIPCFRFICTNNAGTSIAKGVEKVAAVHIL